MAMPRSAFSVVSKVYIFTRDEPLEIEFIATNVITWQKCGFVQVKSWAHPNNWQKMCHEEKC